MERARARSVRRARRRRALRRRPRASAACGPCASRSGRRRWAGSKAPRRRRASRSWRRRTSRPGIAHGPSCLARSRLGRWGGVWAEAAGDGGAYVRVSRAQQAPSRRPVACCTRPTEPSVVKPRRLPSLLTRAAGLTKDAARSGIVPPRRARRPDEELGGVTAFQPAKCPR